MDKLRTLEDVIRDYEEVCRYIKMCEERDILCKSYKKRKKLKKEYESLLPENKKMAILLHDNICRSRYTELCGWYCEMDEGIIHDWTRYIHKDYLKKANKLILSGIDINTMKIVFECLNGSVFNNEI